MTEADQALGILSTAIEQQSELGRRIFTAKTQTTAAMIEEGLNVICRDVIQYVNDWVRIGKRAAFGEGCVLSWVERYWIELRPLHDQYSSFDDFARSETGEEYSTYRAKIAIYRTFLLNESNIERIKDIGPAAFLDVPVGKLQKAVAKAKKGELDEGQWDALLDQGVNDAEFMHIMRREEIGDGLLLQESSYCIVDASSGDLVYFGNPDAVGVRIGRLEINLRDDRAKEEQDRIIAVAGIRRRV